MRRLLLTLMLALLPTTAPAAQPPTRLVQASDLEYLGSVTIPAMRETDGQRLYCEYTLGRLAYRHDTGTLLLACHSWSSSVAEIRLPSSLSGQATEVRAPRDILAGRIGQINPSDPNSKEIGGLLVLGDRLVVSAYSFYDGAGSAVASHFVRSMELQAGGVSGPFRVGDRNPAFYAGYMAHVPQAWQDALGGDVLTGGCCLSIISRTSFGPSVSVVRSADLLAARTTPATMLVGYPQGQTTLGNGERQSTVFTLATRVTGLVFPEGTGSVLFVGRHGTGPYCYGEGSECGDPEDRSKGTHAYPYVPYVWAYRASDLADVKAGRKQPWDVTPYATFRLPSQIRGSQIGGATHDPTTGRIFIAENYGDAERPRIHILRVRGAGTGPAPEPQPEPEPQPQPEPSPSAPQGWVLDWADEFDGSSLDTSRWHVENSTTTSYGGTMQAWRPANVTVQNGYLRLTGRRESSGGRQYTSGAVNTRNRQTFGPEFRLEVRARIPAFRGGWPAIWTREGTMPNPDIGVEIDVMENIGDPNVIYQVQHKWNLDGQPHQKVIECAPFRQSFAGQWHVYAVEVVGGRTTWFVDGQQTCGPSNVAPQQASHLLLNLSIGGSWPGAPDSAATGPWHFDVDYVRVYRRGSGPSTPVDAVVSDWGPWTPIGAWSVCVPADAGSGGVQTRAEERTRTIVTPAQHGGSTPHLRETRVASRACSLPEPEPEPEPDPEPCACTGEPGPPGPPGPQGPPGPAGRDGVSVSQDELRALIREEIRRILDAALETVE